LFEEGCIFEEGCQLFGIQLFEEGCITVTQQLKMKLIKVKIKPSSSNVIIQQCCFKFTF